MSLYIAPPSRPVFKPSLAYITRAQIPTNTDTFSGGDFNGLSFGPVAKRRGLIAVVTARHNSASATVTSLSLGGVSGSLVARFTGSVLARAEIWLVQNDSLASGNAVVNWNTPVNNCGLGIFALTNPVSFTAFSTDEAEGDAQPVVLNFRNSGVGLVVSCITLSSTSCTWANATEVFDAEVESANNTYYSAAIYAATEPQTGRNITPDWVGASANVGSVGASF